MHADDMPTTSLSILPGMQSRQMGMDTAILGGFVAIMATNLSPFSPTLQASKLYSNEPCFFFFFFPFLFFFFFYLPQGKLLFRIAEDLE